MSDTRDMLLGSAKYEVGVKHGQLPNAITSIIPTVVDDVIDALRHNPAWAKSLGIGAS